MGRHVESAGSELCTPGVVLWPICGMQLCSNHQVRTLSAVRLRHLIITWQAPHSLHSLLSILLRLTAVLVQV